VNRFGIVTALLIVFIGCQQEAKKEQVVARVGDAVLTAEQVRAAIDTTRESYEVQARKYVSAWVTTELMFQEAVKRGIDQTNEFQKQLEQVRRDLAVQELLQSVVYGDTTAIPADTLLKYFEQHKDEFFVQEDMVKLNVIGFTTRERAGSFAAGITRGSTWEDAYASLTTEPSVDQEIVLVSKGKYYSQQMLMFPELWKVAQTLRENDVSFPVRTVSGYFIIQMLGSVRSGSTPVFELAEPEVRARALRVREQARYDSLIGTLRQRYSVEIVLPPVQNADSTRRALHE